jgi:tRNA pseudouridine55 synthase
VGTENKTRGKPKALPIDGLLLLNKPPGLTSNQALQKVKRLLRAKKAGHTGSLDPAATGMLPLCFGEATKVCAYLLDADKTYRVTAKLGVATDTADADGQEIATADVPDYSEADWETLIQQFVGESQQIPPMYSALKQNGKRLYELARKGEVVEREPRAIRIDDITLLESHGTRLVMRVSCSKGTYIRTLVEDIAKAAGTIAHTVGLHRETVGSFKAEDMLDLSSAEEWAETAPEELTGKLLSPDVALAGWPSVSIESAEAERFCGGQEVDLPEPAAAGLTRVYEGVTQFLGVGEVTPGRRLAPRRIFNLRRPVDADLPQDRVQG